MRRLMLVWVLLAAAAPTYAQAPETEWLVPCATDSAEWGRAEQAIDAMGGQIEQARPGAAPDVLRDAFGRLRAVRCLERVGQSERAPEIRSTLGLQRWWSDGGEAWLRSLGGDAREMSFPPTERTVLTRESTPPDHPLRRLLCRAGNTRCGAATLDWVERANAALAAHARRERSRPRVASEPAPSCEERARTGAADTSALRWMDCVENQARHAALPLGAFRAPSVGWLVIRGRRGHYGFCDEVRAYDLATGSAYVVQSCSRLALGSTGVVDQGRTDAARRADVQRGRIPTESLREAAWMLLLMESVDRDQADAFTATRAADIPLRWPREVGTFGAGLGSMWSSSAQTRLAWSWVVGNRVRQQGSLTWPDSYRAEEMHALTLLRAAEGALAVGCPPARLPRRLPLGANAAGVSPIDADPRSRQAQEDALAAELRRMPTCR